MPFYNSYKEDLLDGTAPDLDDDTIKVALTTSSYTPDIDTHDYFDDITNEVAGTGYTAGGETLANVAITKDTTDDEGVFDADNTAWTSASFTARYAVIYSDTGTASASPLIAYLDFATDKEVTDGTFTIQWNTEGIININ